MKKIILLISLVYSMAVYSQTGTAIYSINANVINTNNSFIDAFYLHNGGSDTTPYIPMKTYSLIGTNAAYGKFTIRMSRFKGYEDEAGIANVVQLYRDNTCLVTLSSSLNFTSLSSYVNGLVGDFLFRKLADDTYALVFTEWIYASQPPMVSIILIHRNNAKLVYNKKMFINSIKLTPFEMELQANTDEYVNNTPVVAPILHKIWWDGSVLRFQ